MRAAFRAGTCLAALATCGSVFAADAEDRIARGKYVVESVAICQDCHTPRNEKGELDEGRWLEGGPVPFRPTRPGGDWADVVPAIAGLPGWLEDEDVVTLLMTGRRPDGRRPKPPMKAFGMKREDAEAAVAYLRSLRPASK
ncbi:MAG: c-type cytochrome [Candidatus Binatia bacterium]